MDRSLFVVHAECPGNDLDTVIDWRAAAVSCTDCKHQGVHVQGWLTAAAESMVDYGIEHGHKTQINNFPKSLSVVVMRVTKVGQL